MHSQTYTAYRESIANEVRYFVEECVRGGKALLSTLDDAIVAQRMIEACERAVEDGRVIDL